MQPLRGILLSTLAVSLFVVMSSLVKVLERIPAGETVFFRSAFALPVILGWLLWRGNLRGDLRTANWKGHAWRGVMGTSAMALNFAGLRFLPLPEVTALQFATPILIVVFAALILKEKVRLFRISAVFVGLIGVLVIVSPRLTLSSGGTPGGTEAIGALIVLASATFAAFAQVFIKSMSRVEKTAAIVFYFTATSTVLSLFTLPFGWVLPAPGEAAMLIGMGLIGGIGQILLTASYRYADASVLAPFTYVTMIWSLLIGYFVFAEVPTLPMLGGAGLIICAGVAIVLRERHLGLKATAERKVAGKGMH